MGPAVSREDDPRDTEAWREREGSTHGGATAKMQVEIECGTRRNFWRRAEKGSTNWRVIKFNEGPWYFRGKTKFR